MERRSSRLTVQRRFDGEIQQHHVWRAWYRRRVIQHDAACPDSAARDPGPPAGSQPILDCRDQLTRAREREPFSAGELRRERLAAHGLHYNGHTPHQGPTRPAFHDASHPAQPRRAPLFQHFPAQLDHERGIARQVGGEDPHRDRISGRNELALPQLPQLVSSDR